MFIFPTGQRLGGGEEQFWTLLDASEGPHEQSVVIFLAHGPLVSEVASLGVETEVVPSGRMRHPLRFAKAVRSLARLIRSRQPDVVVTWGAKAQVYGGAAALLAGASRRVVWTQLEVHDGGWLHRLATAIPSAAVMCASNFVAAAQNAARPRRRTFVVHPGLADLPRAAADQPLDLQLEAGRPVVGVVGRLQPWKRQDTVLRAIALLRARGHDIHGLFVGGDAYDLAPGYETELHSLARELGLDRAATFTGQVESVDSHLAAMDILVNASEEEPFGLALLEAMAMGVPVVAVDAAGPAEIIRDGRDGLLVPASTPEDIADAVEHLVSDVGLREQLGAAGQRRVRQAFSAERMAREVAAHLEEVAAAGARKQRTS